MKKIYIIISTILLLFVSIPLFSGVTISDPSGIFDPAGREDFKNQMEHAMNINGVPFADSVAFANINGYPVGTSTLKGFPRFLIGMSFSAAGGNLRFRDSSLDNDNKLIPVGSLNPVILFGIGIKKRLDILVKLMIYDSALYLPPLDFGMIRLDKMSMYSGGAKIRYNIVEEIKVLPGIFNFGGLTFGFSVDFMYGEIGVGGDIEIPLGEMWITGAPAGNYNCTYDNSYGASGSWFMVSGNPEIKIHLNFLAIFDIYTGFGFPVHYGNFTLEFDSGGDVIADGWGGGGGGSDNAGTVSAVGKSEYTPFYVQPVWMAGIELNVYILRFTFETMVNLYNRKDISLQIGARTQW